MQALYGTAIRRLDKPDPAARDPSCQVVDPVIVEALTTGATTIAFEPPVTLSCEMAAKAAAWITGGVQPLTRGVFGRELVGLRVGGGHECRRRNRATSGSLSEHATGRALDIFAFVLAGPKEGSLVSVERPGDDAQKRYLSAVRQLGCGAFSTSLGPGADAAHANHLHLDIQWRRSAASKFCQ